jgi:hypothetical protein
VKTWIRILTGVMMLSTLPVKAVAAVPDYVGLSTRIDAVSDFVAMAPYCRAAGYTVVSDEEALAKTVPPTLAEGIKDGISETMAYGMMETSLKAAFKVELDGLRDFDARTEAAARTNNQDAVVAVADEYYARIDVRCQEFTRLPQFSPLITAPESGGRKHFLGWLMTRYEQE